MVENSKCESLLNPWNNPRFNNLERLNELGESLSVSMRQKLLDLFSEQQTFSSVDDASVRLRRIMTEVKAGANILNPNQYPQIRDNTLNFAVPCHNDAEQNQLKNKEIAFGEMESALFSQIAAPPSF